MDFSFVGDFKGEILVFGFVIVFTLLMEDYRLLDNAQGKFVGWALAHAVN